LTARLNWRPEASGGPSPPGRNPGRV
jgi:hypothetical protein